MEKIATHVHFYYPGIHPLLDELNGRIQTIHSTFQSVVEKANHGQSEPIFKLEQSGEIDWME